jgi:hypothetical protein
VAAILEEHLFYAEQYADMFEQKVNHVEFTAQTRLYTFRMQALMQTFGRIAMTIITFIAIGQKFGLKVMFLALFLAWAAQPCQTAPVSTIQGLHNMLLYIRFRKEYGWLQSGFGYKQFAEMETALVDTIIQLMQVATPPTTTTTAAPVFQTKDERIHGILKTFINKTLHKNAKEKEETRQASGLTDEQEQMYSTK